MATLRNRAAKAVKWSIISAGLRGAVHLLQLIVLARLLLPVDFGLVATTVTIVSIFSVVADLGVNSAYLQARDVDEDERSALFFLNLICGISITIVVGITTPLAVHLIGDPRIAPLLYTYSPAFIITALGAQLRYHAEKSLQFRPVAIIEMLATTLGVITTISSALIGIGAISIIFGLVTTIFINTLLCWIFLSNGWRPKLGVQLSKAKRFFSFGLAVICDSFVSQLSTRLDVLIGARLVGTEQFGFYAAPRNFFLQILALINPVVTRVGFPLIAEVQGDRGRVSRMYRKAFETIIGVSAPIYFGAAVFSLPLVVVIFGERWVGVAPSFRLLALWAFCRSMMNPIGNLLLGLGRPGLGLKWNIFQLVIAAILLTCSGVQSSFELSATVLAFMLLQLMPAWFFMIRPLCGMTLREYLCSLSRPSFVSLGSVLLSALSLKGINTEPLIYIMMAVILTCLFHVILSWIFREPWLVFILETIGISKSN